MSFICVIKTQDSLNPGVPSVFSETSVVVRSGKHAATPEKRGCRIRQTRSYLSQLEEAATLRMVQEEEGLLRCIITSFTHVNDPKHVLVNIYMMPTIQWVEKKSMSTT